MNMTNKTDLIPNSIKLKNKSIKTTLQMVIVMLVFVSTIFVAIAAIQSIRESYRTLNHTLRKSLEDQSNLTTKNEVETLATLLASFTQDKTNDQLSDATKNQIKYIVRNAKYNLEQDKWVGYYFLYDLDGTVIAHGNDPMLEGKNLLTLKDPEGPLIAQLRDAAKSGGGFVYYLWNKPTDLTGKYKKVSYAKMIGNTSWWIGSGLYVDDIDKTVDNLRREQQTELQKLLLQFVILTACLIIISLIISLYFAAKISNPIIHLSRIAKKISSGDYKIRADIKSNNELGIMAASFNEMADSINQKMRDLTYKERYASHLLNSVADSLIVTDAKNKIVQINPAAEAIFGYSEKELIGQDINIFIPEELREEYKKTVLDVVLQGKAFTNFNVKRKRKDGTEILLLVTVAPVFEDDGTIYYRIHSAKDMTEQEQMRLQIKQMESLKKYFPTQIIEKLIDSNNDISLSYDRKKVTIFFSDLVGFTELSDGMEAEDVVSLLREYFTSMSEIVYKYSGTLDKFIGDALFVFFGAPSSEGIEQDAVNCINMALDMQKKLDELNNKWQLPHPLTIRMGINTGYVTVGNLGSDMRMEYTIIGTPVNIASRLEHECEPGHILISYVTASYVKNDFELREKGEITLRGIHRLIKTFEVVGRLRHEEHSRQ